MTDAWELAPDGPSVAGRRADVRPVRTGDGRPAVLKVTRADARPAPAADDEHLALQRWRGRGAVRLLRADPGRRALLLERLEPVDLADHWDEQACEVVGGLYVALHVAPMPQLRSLPSYLREWRAALAADAASLPMPRRMVDQALALAADLAAEPPTAVVHGNLHYGNVLPRAEEGTWVAIAPRPVNGDPHYELEPMLRHRFEEYAAPGAFGSVRDGIRRRFHTLVDTADLDEHRARDWVVVRSVLAAHRLHRSGGPDQRSGITRCITVAKAVQD
ncbi:aminoglycoside resistance protein [Nocardioides sp. GY 10113]|nr:aminoglycoside resistance protein [Nocardioides sp. GY 10113]